MPHSPVAQCFLHDMAEKYIWWKTPGEAMRQPQRVIAQVMTIGDFDDMRQLVELLGEDTLQDALAHAEAGQFNGRSWAYWHCRLGLCGWDAVPPLPGRNVP